MQQLHPRAGAYLSG